MRVLRQNKIIDTMLGLPRKRKFAILIAMDSALLIVCMWAAMAARIGQWWPDIVTQFWWLFVLGPLTGVVAFVYLGTYRNVVRYLGDEFYTTALQSVTLHVISLFAIVFVTSVQGVPRSLPIIYWLLCMVAIVGSRVFASVLFRSYLRPKTEAVNTVIFGAGLHGAELAKALETGSSNNVVAFIDDKRAAHGRTIHDARVYATSELSDIIARHKVEMVLLAIPDASKDRLRHLLGLLDEYPVHVKTMPAMSELLSGKASVADLRELEIEDLLGREPVAPDLGLIRLCVTGKSVMVTGAGGSIGGELCRQILPLEPATLILIDISEFALYQIERELRDMIAKEKRLATIQLVPLLATIEDTTRLAKVMTYFETDTVYHAAAYKHVPTVESNPVIAVKNNVFGTKTLAETAAEASVDAFIMVSTDKAVRPSSIMGATKNLAEQLIHMIDRRSDVTRFSIVRFGNVIGSSGSVVPLFRQQIARGGPVTVTHENIERFFMTIPEAAQLVIQAGAMGSGGEQYVLDMGEPVKVLELACRMVRLSGLHVRDEHNPHGDIEIDITGLRPGEKMYEETYQSEDVSYTSHPRINKETGVSIDVDRIHAILSQLEKACADDDADRVCRLLRSAVPGYRPFDHIEDPVWIEKAAWKARQDRAEVQEPTELGNLRSDPVDG